MRLRASSFVHKIPVGPDRVLLVHAISHLRFLANDEIARVFDFFATPRTLPDEALPLMDALGCDRDALASCIGALLERGALTEKDPDAEVAGFGELMAASYGRDPRELLERYRRETKEGGLDYWATGAASSLADFAQPKTRVDAILFGDCDVQMEADFLRREAAAARHRPAGRRDLPGRCVVRRRAQARRGPDRRAARSACDRRAAEGRSPHEAYIAEAQPPHRRRCARRPPRRS